ncbi:MAG: hypothetical protein MUF07_16660 [Steroidobacteraceae bacterium]|jgi:hypothetical protein|nr:hypothetical protein [Steroidobacteraceae bacterium]
MDISLSALTSDFQAELDWARPPCLSLYQPTHRHHPDNQQDPIRFRNLLRSLSDSLARRHAAAEIAALMAPLEALADDTGFWNHTLDGLAAFAAPDRLRVFLAQRPLPELAIAADSFHIKPLRRLLQSRDRFQLLAVDRQSIRLFEGHRDALDEIEPAVGVPRTLAEALGEEVDVPPQTIRSQGATAVGAPMVPGHGHGGRSDDLDVDTERFFRIVDRAVFERHSRPSGLPLLLAALPEHQGAFRRLSRNSLLVAEGITLNPSALSHDELRERAWQVFEPTYRQRLETLAGEYHQARARGLASDSPAAVVEAASTGRVAKLMIEADRQLQGRIDAATGRIEPGEIEDPAVDDLLDDLGELALQTGGEVWVVPAASMPTGTGVAATYRYAAPAGGRS